MSLTDLMSGANLDAYAQVALLLFLLAFVIVVIRLFTPGRRAFFDRAARMPLDDDTPTDPRPRGD
jgi:cbb3-type cytochrome oxidase subunit 3